MPKILLTVLIIGGAAFASEGVDPKVTAQIKLAQENWAILEAGEPALHETPHCLIVASKPLEGKLKDFGVLLEKHYTKAEEVVKPEKNERWPGKMTVYLFAERDEFTAFVRRVSKRRLDPEETTGHSVEGAFPHVFTGPPRSKVAGNLEQHAAEELAAALMHRKAGDKVVLPDWLLMGFGRATSWRIGPRDPATTAARTRAIEIMTKKKYSVQQVWGGDISPEERAVLRASLADLLAYGPGSSRFPQFIVGFRPEDNNQPRSPEQALGTTGIKVENLAKVWPDFVRNLR